MERSHDFRVESRAQHEQEWLTVRIPKIQLDNDSVVDYVQHGCRVGRLPYVPAQQVFRAHWYDEQRYSKWYVSANDRGCAVTADRERSPQLAGGMCARGQVNKICQAGCELNLITCESQCVGNLVHGRAARSQSGPRVHAD